MMLTLEERKTWYIGHNIGHIIRGENYEFLRQIMNGKVQDKRCINSRQHFWTKDILRWFGCSTIDIFSEAVSKTTLAIWMDNLRGQTARDVDSVDLSSGVDFPVIIRTYFVSSSLR